ncbi:MAG TPA: histidine kinase [Desulfuromonas sp.]|nr:histidine kinase [Desulfuromonas sp.]HBT83417.1 histidine kinase [Desulfuromonas sp.]
MGSSYDDNKFIAKTVQASAPPAIQRKKLGQVLVESEILTQLTVERILQLSRAAGKRFGEVLEDLGLVTGEELAQALATQYGYPVVADFAKYAFSDDLLKLMPAETAAEHIIFPLKLQGNILGLAMADPTNEKVVHNIQDSNKVVVKNFIASRKDILQAIAVHYLKREEAKSGKAIVLLAENDKNIVKAMSDSLNKNNYEVIVATDGIEALKKAVCYKPALIVADKDMPKINGYMLLSSLKNTRETKNIPVILIAASTQAEEEALAYDKGFADYISKPVKEIILLTKVKKAILFNINPYVVR